MEANRCPKCGEMVRFIAVCRRHGDVRAVERSTEFDPPCCCGRLPAGQFNTGCVIHAPSANAAEKGREG